ncbi:MAG: hypothetical protein EBT86_07425 [Actinobacteria bacterium]|nr:hypothetical protein [Actinomycetota bacterium]
MENKIAIVLPVRNFGTMRYERLPRCLDSYLEMTEGLADVFVLHDDDECDIYDPILEKYPSVNNLCIKSGLTLMEKINVPALDIANKYKHIGFIGDDIVFRTKWESEFISFLSSRKIALAFANENTPYAGGLAAHPFINSSMVKAVGFFGCPVVTHQFFDNYWHEITLTIGEVKYFPDIIMEHRHPIVYKDIKDKLYEKIESDFPMNRVNYINYKKSRMLDDIRKMLEYEE